MLRAVLDHLFGQLIVHVVLNSCRCLLFFPRYLADDLCFDRSVWRKGLDNRLRLELHDRFGQDGVINTTGAFPRLCSVVYPQAKEFKTLLVSPFPVLSGVLVDPDHVQNVVSDLLKVSLWHLIR